MFRRRQQKKMRKYKVIIGSKTYFNNAIHKILKEKSDSFLELIELHDKLMKNGKILNIKSDRLIIKNDSYLGITNSAVDRIGPLIEDVTNDDALICVHNPPRVLMDYLSFQKEEGMIELFIDNEKYSIKRNASSFLSNMNEIESHIFGQKSAIVEISKTLWYLTSVERKKPYVIMLYGESSLGKTELVREVSKTFFQNKCLEKHLSMFKNNNYSSYFFGDEPNRRSIGFDLLERESNLLFLDELDKCPEHFFSAFYTLFDNTLFKDSTYDVDISGLVIFLTSNYSSEVEIKNNLGLPIFNRIDKMIHFNDFDPETIYKIVMNEINLRCEEYQSIITPEALYAKVSPRILISGENARTIKYKVQQAIEDILFHDLLKENDKQ